MGPIETIEEGRFRIKIYQDEDAESPRNWDNVGTMVCWHSRYNLGDEQPTIDPEQYLENLATAVDPALRDEINLHRYPEDWDETEVPKTDAEIEAMIQATLNEHYVILPLYLFDHSGISISTGSFHDPWDSGQVGFIYASKEKAKEGWGQSPRVRHNAPSSEFFTEGLLYVLTDQGEVLDNHGKPRRDDSWVSPLKPLPDEEVYAHYLKGEVETYDQYLRGDVYGYVIETKAGVEKDSLWNMYGYDYCLEEAKSVVASFADEPIKKFEFTFTVSAEGEDYDEALDEALATGVSDSDLVSSTEIKE